MKICLLNDSFAPVIDGVVNVVMNYADHLIRDHEADVIVGTPRYPDADYGGYPYRVVPYRSFDTTAITSGYRAGNPFSEKAVTELAAFSPELIHTHCPASSTILARLLREETGAPIDSVSLVLVPLSFATIPMSPQTSSSTSVCFLPLTV